MAEIGTPLGCSHCGEIDGHWCAGVGKRELACAALVTILGVQGWPCQSNAASGAGPSMPSQYGVLLGVKATFVKIVFCRMVAMTLGLVREFEPGATPKKPASGLIAHKRPSGPGCIQAISSPTVHTFQPSDSNGDFNMARFVLPHALGKAP